MQSSPKAHLPYRLVILVGLLVSMLFGACSSPSPPSPPFEGNGSPSFAATQSPDSHAPDDAFLPNNPPDVTQIAATGMSAAGKFLVFGSSGEPNTLDCMNTTTSISLIVTTQILDSLVTMAPGSLDLVPALAESWESANDATEWIFHLRKGVKFHDGTPFGAEAVVFNFQRAAEPTFPYGYREFGNTFTIFAYLFGGYVGDETTKWVSIAAIDEHTVKFTLNESTPFFPHYVAAAYFGLSSPTSIKEHGIRYGTSLVGAIGTGPYQFLEWKAGQSITLARNEHYWGEPALMPGIVFRFIDDAAQRLAELQAGTIDFTTNLSPDARDVLAKDPTLERVDVEPFNISYLAMNIDNPPFDDVRVRQAIAYAIDREAILDEFYAGAGSVAVDFLPDVLDWARAPDLEPYNYNPQKAKALLAAAGYPDGFTTMTYKDGTEGPVELWYMPVSRPYYPTPRPIAEKFATYLADVGIVVQLKTETWAAYIDNWETGNKNGLTMLGWIGDYGDPNNFLKTHFGHGNVAEAGYANQQVIDFLTEASKAATQKEAAEAFRQAGKLINEDMPRLPIVHASPVYARKKSLTGWYPGPIGTEPFASIMIAK
jgi:peptide/nickel transport system substrate-binding protein